MAEKGEKRIDVNRPSMKEKANTNKWLIAAVATVLVMVGLVMASRSGDATIKTAPPKAKALTLGDVREADWQAKAQAEVRDNNKQMGDLKTQNEKLRASLDDNRKAMDDMRALMAEIKQRTDNVETNSKAAREAAEKAAEESKKAPKRQLVPEDIVPPPGEEGGEQEQGYVAPPLPTNGGYSDARTSMESRRRQVTPEAVVMSFGPPEGAKNGTVSKTTYKKNAFAGYLPAGSFADGALLAGMDAGASEYTRANPQPAVIRISDNAITAGDGEYKLEGCNVIGAGYGDLSSERAYIRLSRLICLDKKQGLVLETKIDGFIVDSDGTQGLRGEVVRRSGQVIAKAALAGVAEGIAGIARSSAQAASTSITSPVSGGTQVSSTQINPQDLARAGGYAGASSAAERVADYYLKEAQQIFPVISIPPGRKVTIMLTQGSSLQWESYTGIYKPDVRPEAK